MVFKLDCLTFADVNFCFLAVIDDCDGDDGVHQRRTAAAWRERDRERESQGERQSGSFRSGLKSGWAESQGKLQDSHVGAEATPQGLLNVTSRWCFLAPCVLSDYLLPGCPTPLHPQQRQRAASGFVESDATRLQTQFASQPCQDSSEALGIMPGEKGGSQSFWFSG